MPKNKTYFEQRDNDNILKMREMLIELPPRCADFMRNIEANTTTLTRLGICIFYRLRQSTAKPSTFAKATVDESADRRKTGLSRGLSPCRSKSPASSARKIRRGALQLLLAV